MDISTSFFSFFSSNNSNEPTRQRYSYEMLLNSKTYYWITYIIDKIIDTKFEHLFWIVDSSESPEPVGFCLKE